MLKLRPLVLLCSVLTFCYGLGTVLCNYILWKGKKRRSAPRPWPKTILCLFTRCELNKKRQYCSACAIFCLSTTTTTAALALLTAVLSATYIHIESLLSSATDVQFKPLIFNQPILPGLIPSTATILMRPRQRVSVRYVCQSYKQEERTYELLDIKL